MWADRGTHEVYATATKFYVSSIFSCFWNFHKTDLFPLLSEFKKRCENKDGAKTRCHRQRLSCHFCSCSQTAWWILLFNLVIICVLTAFWDKNYVIFIFMISFSLEECVKISLFEITKMEIEEIEIKEMDISS